MLNQTIYSTPSPNNKNNKYGDMRDSNLTATKADLSLIQENNQDGLFGSNKQVIVNTVNCVGVMGKGIALAFKNRYPEMFQDYKKRCRNNQVELGKPYLWKPDFGSQWILNFPTKGHWRNKSSLASIEGGLIHLAAHAKDWGIESLALPALGCGCGGLNWTEVRPLIVRHLEPLGIPIDIYPPLQNKVASKHSTTTSNQNTSNASSDQPLIHEYLASSPMMPKSYADLSPQVSADQGKPPRMPGTGKTSSENGKRPLKNAMMNPDKKRPKTKDDFFKPSPEKTSQDSTNPPASSTIPKYGSSDEG
ncbi:MAG: macro domain-containing protein [Gammaproteobacteria bacterium]|nr:macro domain-containing protein [Gammaproteobacteria bacterium]